MKSTPQHMPAADLDRLIHRLAECPPDFLDEPRIGQKSGIHGDAVVHDVLFALGKEPPNEATLASFRDLDETRGRPFLRLVLVACWLLADDAFRGVPEASERARSLLVNDIRALAQVVGARQAVEDPDRREELARLCLARMGLLPVGETPTQAADRLRALDSDERLRILADTRAQQERARRLREAMRKKEAEEAAAKAGREW